MRVLERCNQVSFHFLIRVFSFFSLSFEGYASLIDPPNTISTNFSLEILTVPLMGIISIKYISLLPLSFTSVHIPYYVPTSAFTKRHFPYKAIFHVFNHLWVLDFSKPSQIFRSSLLKQVCFFNLHILLVSLLAISY